MEKIVIRSMEYPCRVTMGAMIRFKRETGRDVSKIESGDVADMICFMWCCVTSACKADKVEFGMNLEEFADSFDVNEMQEFVTELISSGSVQKKTQDAPEK
jgi:hypothetical protein